MKKVLFSIFSVMLCIISTIYSSAMLSVYADEGLEFQSNSAILIDYNSGDVLFEQNADDKVPVASIVKLMTILLTFEEIEKGNLSLNENLISSEDAAGMGGSQVFIDPYNEYSIEEMLKSVIVASANDASVALAEKIAGSENSFVKKMNKRAKEIGLKDTVYVNASGLPEPGQYSTARDVAKLTKEVLKHKEYFKYSTIWMDSLTHPSGRITEVVNTNKLIRYFKGCDSGKTGFTDESGYCLSASAERGGMRLIGVILKAKNSTERFNETSKLLNYGFSSFQNKQIISTDNPITEMKVLKSKTQSIPIYAEEDFFGIIKKGENTDYGYTIEIQSNGKAPFKKGNVVGKISINKNGVFIKDINLITAQDVEKLTFSEGFKEITSKW